MKFRSSGLVDHTAPVEDPSQPPRPPVIRHPIECLCHECWVISDQTRMALKLKGTWGELV